MKFAAFISIIVSVAVMFGACAGAVGPPGKDGAAGKDGATGATGPQGPKGEPGEPAPLPLTGRMGPVVLDNLKAGDDENEATEHMIDLMDAGYFHGGAGPFMYEITGVTDSDDAGTAINIADTAPDDLTAEIDGNMLKIKLVYTAGTTTYTDADYMKGYTIALKAVDSNSESAVSSVVIKPNRAPVLVSGVTADATTGDLTDPNDQYVIGTMSGEIDADDTADGIQPRTDGVASCSMFNMCEITLFSDDEGTPEVSVTSDPKGKYSWSVKDGKLMVTGLASTYGAAADAPVDVDVMATDAGGLSLEVTFMLSVNAPPMPSSSAAGVDKSVEFTLGSSGGVLSLITQAGAVALFEDPESDTVVATFESSNTSIITVDESSGAVVPVSRGTTTITVTGTTGTQASDTGGLGQSAKIDFTVTVK